MPICLRRTTDADVREFVTWTYDPPYDVYNITMDPDDAVNYFLEADIQCHALADGDEVVGYCTFGQDAQVPGGDYEGEGLDIGLGVKPSRVGSGGGHHFVAAVVAHATETFEPRHLRVTIAASNQRALRVWSGAGFTEVSRFGTAREIMGSSEFVVLVREADAKERA